MNSCLTPTETTRANVAPAITRAKRWIVGVAIASFVAGAVLSHRIEPGVRVEKTTVAGDTPAIRLFPATQGPHPIALLAHGFTASKETLFRYGEALAHAGFDCFSVDLPGHGESRQSFAIGQVAAAPEKIARALEAVDVFLGHSMGAGAGAWSVREAGFRPKLFIALGANVDLGQHGPPLLLLAGQFEEFLRPAQLKARTDARVVISPWSDHGLELCDSHLVNAAVEAACATLGKQPPAAPTAWRWRFVGLALGMLGALGLMICLPDLSPPLTRGRGLLVPSILILAIVLTTGTLGGSVPQLRRFPLQIAIMIVTWLALLGIGKLEIPRWILPTLGAIFVIGSVIAIMNRFASVILLIPPAVAAAFLLAGTLIGRIAARNSSRRDGNLAFAIFVGYVIGQWIPKFA